MPRKSNRQIRTNLHKKQEGKCFWCYVLTIENNTEFKKGQIIPNNTATLDHVYHKGHPLKSNPPKNGAYVLSCFSCNQKRAALQEKTNALVIIKEGRIDYVKCDSASIESIFDSSGN